MSNQWILSEYQVEPQNQQPATFVKKLHEMGLRVSHTTMRGGRRDGVELLTIHDNDFEFSIIPTRGMGIHTAKFRSEMIGWTSPVEGPVHPKFVPLSEPSGLGWLDGFDELLVRCGLESNGAPQFDETNGNLQFGLHGRIANQPAEDVVARIDGNELCVSAEVRETRLLCYNVALQTEIRTQTGENGFRIRDRIVNRSAKSTTAQLLYHINLGAPLLGEGAQVVCPAVEICPRNDHAAKDIQNWQSYAGPTPGFEEMVYFFQLAADDNGQTTALLKSRSGNSGIRVSFNINQLPYFIVWKNTAAEQDGYVTGLEPATNFPNPKSFEAQQGRVIPLDAGGTYEIDLAVHYLRSADQVQTVENKISELADLSKATVHQLPQSAWCS